MFADAGYPVASDGTMSDALFDELVVSGDSDTVAQRLDRIGTLLGEGWSSPDRALELQLALRLRLVRDQDSNSSSS